MKVFGRNIKTDWREIRSRMGVCQQENSLDPDLSVKMNLLLYARYFEMDRDDAPKRAEDLMNFFP